MEPHPRLSRAPRSAEGGVGGWRFCPPACFPLLPLHPIPGGERVPAKATSMLPLPTLASPAHSAPHLLCQAPLCRESAPLRALPLSLDSMWVGALWSKGILGDELRFTPPMQS